MTIFDDIGDAAESVVKDVGNGVKKIGTTLGDVFESGGVLVVDALDNVRLGLEYLVRGAIGIRKLRTHERALADRVFQGTIPYERVVVISLDGLGGKPFVLRGDMLVSTALVPGVGPLLAITSLMANLLDKYIIFMGSEGYRDAINVDLSRKYPGQVLAHELTHVWQGTYDPLAWGYLFNSVSQRCLHIGGDSIYAYTAGKKWTDYGSEQQANIVDDYFKDTEGVINARVLTHANFPYIRDVIRARNRDAAYMPARVLAKPTVVHKMTKAEADALLAQASAMRTQGQQLVRTGNPVLIAQGQMFLANAQQIEAAVQAAGFPVYAIRMPGAATVVPSFLDTTTAATTRIKMPGSGIMSASPLIKK